MHCGIRQKHVMVYFRHSEEILLNIWNSKLEVEADDSNLQNYTIT